MSDKRDESTFLVAHDVSSADAGAAGTTSSARSASATGTLTTRGILRGVMTTLFFALVISVGFGVVGYLQNAALGQRPVNTVNREKCSCDCFDGAVISRVAQCQW